jgi:hypothetical protein
MTTLEKEIVASVQLAGYNPNPNAQAFRAQKLASVRSEHPTAKVIVVRDEYTGCRFGKAKRNAGRCRKLGSNSTNRGGDGSNCYQVWARW